MAKHKKLKMYQFRVSIGNHPRTHFYAISGYDYASPEEAHAAGRLHAQQRGHNPRKCTVLVNDRNFWRANKPTKPPKPTKPAEQKDHQIA